MRVTDMVIVNSEYRHWRKAVTMLETIQRRLEWHMKHDHTQIGLAHVARAAEIADLLRHEIEAPRLLWEINSSLSSWPILKLPVKDVLAYIFQGLTAPGPAQLTELENAVVETMNIKGRTSKAAQHAFKLNCEIAYRHRQGWYMVFNTLTVDTHNYYRVFRKDSVHFKNYIRKVDRAVKIDAPEYHTYFACVEEGTEHGRMHIHVIHFIKQIPDTWRDPNRARVIPNLRQIAAMWDFWFEGWSTPYAVRYSPRDAYGLAGWRWPVDEELKQREVNSPLALGIYMTKYITKSHQSEKRDKLLWRIRKTHKLGQHLLDLMVQQLTPQHQRELIKAEQITLRWGTKTIPTHLIRQTCLRHLQSSTNPNASEILTLGKSAKPRPSPLHYLRGSTQRIDANNQPNTGASQTTDTTNGDTFNEALAALTRAANSINDEYFPWSNYANGSTSSADHIFATPQSTK